VRSARGHDGAGPAACGPLISAAGLRRRCFNIVLRRVISEPGGPAKAERAVDHGLVPTDRRAFPAVWVREMPAGLGPEAM